MEILQYKDMSELLNEADDIKKRSEDYMIPKRENPTTRFAVENGTPILKFKPEKGKCKTLSMTDYSLRALCSKLGLPAAYITKCITERKADLAEKNMNTWLREYGNALFVRATDDHIRGVLSSRYSSYDVDCMLKDIADVMGDIDRYEVKQSLLNEERLHLRFVGKDPLNVAGEDLFPGFTIDSSDIGRSCLEVNAIIYKQVCTNGLMLPRRFESLLLQRHIGIDTQDLREEFIYSIDKIGPLITKMETSVIDTAKKPLTLRYSNQSEEEASEQKLHRELGLLIPEAKRVLDIMKQGTYPENRWGLINAITEAAQAYTLERRLELERTAGRLLV